VVEQGLAFSPILPHHWQLRFLSEKEKTMTTLKVEGMSCMHCVKAVTDALAAVPGVERVREVSLEKKQAVVEGSAVADALVAAVKEAGYQAEAA
jgi:copper chaperone